MNRKALPVENHTESTVKKDGLHEKSTPVAQGNELIAKTDNTRVESTSVNPDQPVQADQPVNEVTGTPSSADSRHDINQVATDTDSGDAEANAKGDSNESAAPADHNDNNSNAGSENRKEESPSANSTGLKKESDASSNSGNNITANDSAQTKSATAQAAPDSTRVADYAPQTNPSSGSLLKTIISHLFIEAYYTPEMAKTNMSINSSYTGPGSKNLTDYKNETSQYCFSAGVNLGYNIGSHWKVLSGIQSSTYNKTSVYNEISVIADSVYQEQFVDPPHGGGHHNGGGHGPHHGGGQGGHGHPNPGNPGGDPGGNHHFVIHTSCGSIDLDHVPNQAANATNGDTLNIKTEVTETIHFFNVPLLVRYSFGTKKLSYFVEAGGAMNFVSRDKVEVVVDDATVEDNSLNSLNSINYSLLFGAGVNYTLYRGLGMFVMPSIRYSITPVNIDSPVNSYPYYLGVSAGINFEF
jgi:hypothetical protein